MATITKAQQQKYIKAIKSVLNKFGVQLVDDNEFSYHYQVQTVCGMYGINLTKDQKHLLTLFTRFGLDFDKNKFYQLFGVDVMNFNHYSLKWNLSDVEPDSDYIEKELTSRLEILTKF